MEKESYLIQKELESMRKVQPFTHYTCRASKNKVVKKYIKKAVYTLSTGLVFFPNNLTANKKNKKFNISAAAIQNIANSLVYGS